MNKKETLYYLEKMVRDYRRTGNEYISIPTYIQHCYSHIKYSEMDVYIDPIYKRLLQRGYIHIIGRYNDKYDIQLTRKAIKVILYLYYIQMRRRLKR